MTVLTSSNKVVIPGDGVTTSFSFPFIGVDAAYLDIIYTDAAGNETTIAQGPGSTQCQVTLNAAAPGALWGVGGTVVYNPAGTPIALGTSLTIARQLPLTQTISLQNQASYGQYASAAEQADDLLEMQTQQVSELFQRALVAPISDPLAPLPLPTAQQRAGQYLAFDAGGNPIAASGPAGNVPISTAMQPVVAAATLALARSAMGLGAVATEGIGAGLQDDGAGKLRVNFPTAAVAVNQAPGAADCFKQYVTSTSISFTLARANTLWDGYQFSVFALGAALVTLVPDANDAIGQGAAGASFIVPAGATFTIRTDGLAAGTWGLDLALPRIPTFQNPELWNGQIVESHASNAATLAIKTLSGDDPSPANPVYAVVRDGNAALGDFSVLALTAATAITLPAGATIGTANGAAFRLWLVAFNDGGTLRLGVINCLSGSSIYPLGQNPIASSTLVSAGATGAQTFYSAGAGVSSKGYCILGYLTWGSGLATAGQWTASPSVIRLAGNGCPLPGTVIQEVINQQSGVTTGTTVIPADITIPQNTEGDLYLSTSISYASKANVIEAEGAGQFAHSADPKMISALFTDSNVNAWRVAYATANANNNPVRIPALKHRTLPGAANPQVWKLRAGAPSAGTTTFNGTGGAGLFGGTFDSYLNVKEIMA